jgi:hypothetical protein
MVEVREQTAGPEYAAKRAFGPRSGNLTAEPGPRVNPGQKMKRTDR